MTDVKDKITQLDEYLIKQREDWTQKIKGLTEELSYRQILVEHLATMGNRIKTQKSVVDRKYKDKWIEYYSYDYKLTDKMREKFVDADIADDTNILELLVTQKSFFEGSIKTLDNMGFAIKNRLDISRL
jgi:hypothetical protein